MFDILKNTLIILGGTAVATVLAIICIALFFTLARTIKAGIRTLQTDDAPAPVEQDLEAPRNQQLARDLWVTSEKRSYND